MAAKQKKKAPAAAAPARRRSAAAPSSSASAASAAGDADGAAGEALFARVVRAFAKDPLVEPPSAEPGAARKFGSRGLKVSGKIFAMMASRGRFVVKLPEPRVEVLESAGAGARFDMGNGRVMKEWLTVAARDESTWLDLAREARAFVGSAG